MTPPPLALTPEEQAAFLQSVDQVQQAAQRGLEVQPDGWAVVAFVRHLQRGVDSVVAAVRDQGVQLDCAAGCSHCCHARVEAMAPEIFQIASVLAARPPLEQAETLARLQAYLAVQTPHASPQDAPWSRRPACPFLAEQLCTLYAVRPAACRKAHSRDVAACAGDAALIPQSLELAVHAEALQLGTAAAYRQRGLDAQPHELVQAVLLALRDPSALGRWQAGEPVFEVAPP